MRTAIIATLLTILAVAGADASSVELATRRKSSDFTFRDTGSVEASYPVIAIATGLHVGGTQPDPLVLRLGASFANGDYSGMSRGGDPYGGDISGYGFVGELEQWLSVGANSASALVCGLGASTDHTRIDGSYDGSGAQQHGQSFATNSGYLYVGAVARSGSADEPGFVAAYRLTAPLYSTIDGDKASTSAGHGVKLGAAIRRNSTLTMTYDWSRFSGGGTRHTSHSVGVSYEVFF